MFVAGKAVGDLTPEHDIVELAAGQLRGISVAEAVLADNREVLVQQAVVRHAVTVVPA